MTIAFKTVVIEANGHIHSLGMGRATKLPLPRNRLINGGKWGISAAKSPSGARAVIRFVKSRKVKPQPNGKMVVFKIEGRHKIFENRWRVIYRQIRLSEAL